MTDQKTKKELILEYLKKHGTITPDEARIYCRKCERLGARICDLRREGYNIVTLNHLPDGTYVNYAIYKLEDNNA